MFILKNLVFCRFFFKNFVFKIPASVSRAIIMGISNISPPANMRAPKNDMYLPSVIRATAAPLAKLSKNFKAAGMNIKYEKNIPAKKSIKAMIIHKKALFLAFSDMAGFMNCHS